MTLASPIRPERHSRPRALLRGLLAALICILFLNPETVAQEEGPTIAGIDRQIAALDEDGRALSEEDRAAARDLLERARGEIERANARAAEVAAHEEAAASGAETRARLEAELAALETEDAPPELPETSSGLRSRLNFLQSERAVRAGRRAELLNRRTQLAGRASAIAEEIAEARDVLADLTEAPLSDADDGDTALERARRTLLEARIAARRAQVDNLQRELQTIPERQSIVAARIALSDAEIDALDTEIARIQQRQSDVRMDRADTAFSRAVADLEAAQALPDPATAIAEENVRLATMLKAMADDALRIEQQIKALTEQTLQIRQQADTVERIIETGRITDEVGALLRQLRASLPNAQNLRAEIDDTVEARASTQLNLILWQDRLRALRDQASLDDFSYDFSDEIDEIDEEAVPNEAAAGDPAAPDGGDAPGESEATGAEPVSPMDRLLAQRARLLGDLIAAGRAQSDRLTDLEIRLTETFDQAQTLRNTLDRRLLWLPSNTRPLRNFGQNLEGSADLLTSPDALTGLLGGVREAVSAQPFLLLAALLVAILTLLGRRRLQADLGRLNEAVGKIPRDKYSTTPLAILSCLALAFPLPALLSAIPLPVMVAGDQSPVLRGLAAGTLAVATMVLLILFARTMGEKDGVLTTHFNWSERALEALHRPPAWFLAAVCVTLFAFAGAMASGQADAQHGIGMLAFVLLSLAIAIIGYGTFDLDDGLVCRVVSEGTSSLFLLTGLVGFSLAPLVIGALPLFGYLDTAVALQVRVLETAGLLLAVAIVYGVLRRLLLIAQRRLALRRALERRAQRAAERSERAESGEQDEDEDEPMEPPSALQDLEEERQRISNQTRRLLLYLTGAAGLAGLLAIWATILPAFGVANDITLWTGTGTIDGVRTARPVTLLNLILFFLFIVAGFVAAYNIRGVLEIGPFQRLKLSHGSRYAIDTIIGYFLIGTGIVAGFLQLGVDWSRLQWIIAALGVGLGFGLQEIVANFISGLIILFERPVRVGDTVTIGDLEGNVTNVAIRATTIRDFDNREVLLPNKSIITENVTNWTLRDSVMRIIVPIGVAYGSDVDQVRELLLKIAQEENDVLETPEPRVFFMNHGDSSLDFEVRVFISNPRKRFRVRDELNTAINKALNEAGIVIPFPQRDVHLYKT